MSGNVRVAVLGAGSWGTAVAKVMADAGRDVTLWARRAELAEAVNTTRTNPDYLPGIALPDRIRATTDPAEALRDAAIAVLAVPAQTLRSNLDDWGVHIEADASVVSLAKGIELGSGQRMSEVVMDTLGVKPDRVVVLSGPNLAKEVARQQPAATVIACVDHDRAAAVQDAVTTPYLRPYTNTDVVGCELGGAVKNVIALACGLVDGLGFGDNTKASLITRGLAETSRLGAALGANPLTFAGLAGLGDLVATCASPLSRNRTFGQRLGRGETFAQAKAATKQTAEGVVSCLAIRELAHQHEVEMPITEQVVRVCHEGVGTAEAIRALMARETRPEHDG